MPGLSEAETRELFLAACRAELSALKPGNVHVHAGGHGMEPAQFEAGAVAAAPWIAASKLKVGERVLRGVEASFAAAGCNTNLGILLLAAPLAAAAQMAVGGDLRTRLRSVLADLDGGDAAAVFAAIRQASRESSPKRRPSQVMPTTPTRITIESSRRIPAPAWATRSRSRRTPSNTIPVRSSALVGKSPPGFATAFRRS